MFYFMHIFNYSAAFDQFLYGLVSTINTWGDFKTGEFLDVTKGASPENMYGGMRKPQK